jgi:4-hydroxy-2-oxoheptanedioate aldolase
MELPVNHFKRALQANRPQIGLWCNFATHQTVELLSRSGFGWLLLDMEHAPSDMDTLHRQLMAMVGGNSSAVVRPPWNDTVMIKRCLDIGAQSLLLPYVQTEAEARAAVAATRYPPEGVRGVAGSTRAAGYGRVKDYLNIAHRELCLLVQLETRKSLDNLEAICRIDGIDGVFIGPNDLAADMGHRANIPHPEVQSAIADAIKRIRACGKAPGILVGEADGQRMLDQGAVFVAVGSDTGILRTHADALLHKFKS